MLLKRDPFRVDTYKALRKIYMDTHQYDKTWCMCSALAFLQRPTPTRCSSTSSTSRRASSGPRTRLTDEMWAQERVPPRGGSLHRRDLRGGVAGAWRCSSRASTSSSASSARTSATCRPIRRCSPRCSTTSRRCSTSRCRRSTSGPSSRAGCSSPTRMEKSELIPSFVVGAELLQGRSDKELAFPLARLPHHCGPSTTCG